MTGLIVILQVPLAIAECVLRVVPEVLPTTSCSTPLGFVQSTGRHVRPGLSGLTRANCQPTKGEGGHGRSSVEAMIPHSPNMERRENKTSSRGAHATGT